MTGSSPLKTGYSKGLFGEPGNRGDSSLIGARLYHNPGHLIAIQDTNPNSARVPDSRDLRPRRFCFTRFFRLQGAIISNIARGGISRPAFRRHPAESSP
jgi:hypothetical protein